MEWFITNWQDIVIPLAIFVAVLIACIWLRRLAYGRLYHWAKKTRWAGDEILLQATRVPSLLWCVLAGIYLSITVSTMPAAYKVPAGRAMGSLLVLSIGLCVMNVATRMARFYGTRWNLPEKTVSLAGKLVGAVILAAVVLTIMDVWGVPMLAVVLILAALVILAVTVFREALADLLAGLQISARNHIQIGDYVKLGDGAEGTVTHLGWRYAQFQSLDGSVLTIPNSRLLRSTLVNYGKPLKKASAPFKFYTQVHITELTGQKARNMQQLASILRLSPDSVVYYHTHHFLQSHNYLVPEPANDFAVWVSDVLGEEEIGERLAVVDTFEFPSLAMLRERIVGIIEECLGRGMNGREAPEGQEFHFMKSVTVGLPTPYVAHDLREFVEALRKISLGSLYFHVFESRLRLGRGLNDFSIWLQDSLDEPELGQEIARVFQGRVEHGRFYQTSFNGSRHPSGVYYYVLESDGGRLARRMLLMK